MKTLMEMIVDAIEHVQQYKRSLHEFIINKSEKNPNEDVPGWIEIEISSCCPGFTIEISYDDDDDTGSYKRHFESFSLKDGCDLYQYLLETLNKYNIPTSVLHETGFVWSEYTQTSIKDKLCMLESLKYGFEEE